MSEVLPDDPRRRTFHNAVAYWMSIEVLDGASPASGWADAYGDRLVEAALSGGAVDWAWHRHSWGVVFEVAFADEQAWDAYRTSPGVEAALDAVPDPNFGLIISRGRGGSAGTRDPRRPPLLSGSGAAALPLPFEPFEAAWPPDWVDVDRRRIPVAR
ncbi:MAG: hypothetical protein M3Q48_07290 [Actinomycetota bacterium]|nr:hypothetical protein [Actinomycetota bacterium]